MTARRQKRSKKYRGSKTHGCGSMKKRRGAGNRGGRGNAGSGKRGDAKKGRYVKVKNYFGKHGFKIPGKTPVKTVTLAYFQQKLDRLVKENKATEKSGVYSVKLADLGYEKLLATGVLTKKVHFVASSASAGAIEKVKKAGGDVEVLKATAPAAPVKTAQQAE